jgi:hypothetical protein
MTMPYKIKKSIQQYSLVDLLEIMRNERHQEYQLARDEFQKRKPSDEELGIARKGLEIRIKTRNKPLSFGDKIYCFLRPFLVLAKYSTESWNEFERQQIDEFEMYGEIRRVEELKKWQAYARIAHLSLIGLMILTGLIFLIITAIKQIS